MGIEVPTENGRWVICYGKDVIYFKFGRISRSVDIEDVVFIVL